MDLFGGNSRNNYFCSRNQANNINLKNIYYEKNSFRNYIGSCMKLVINGGQIYEANIIVENGGTLIIENDGLIQPRHNGQYLTQIGAKVSIYNGKVNYTP